MKHRAKLNSDEQHQQQAHELKAQAAQPREFATAEEVLRYDAAQTSVPTAVADRLEQSTRDLPPPVHPWWRRWFGR